MTDQLATQLPSVKNLWWLAVLFGVITLGIGLFFVVSPHETLATFAVIAGIFLVIDGVGSIVGSIIRKGEGRGILAITGEISRIPGLILVKPPSGTRPVFAIIVGIWFVSCGVVRVV